MLKKLRKSDKHNTLKKKQLTCEFNAKIPPKIRLTITQSLVL